MQEDGKRAYNALLTLLQDEKPVKRSKRSAETELRPGREVDLAAIEGNDMADEDDATKEADQAEEEAEAEEEEDQEEAEGEIQVEDDNEGDLRDPFESHFSSPPEFSDPATQWMSQTIKTLPLFGDRSVFQTPEIANLSLDPAQLAPLTSKQALASIKHRLLAPFSRANGDLTPRQRELSAPLLNYADVFITDRQWETQDEVLNLVVLHLVNHIYKTRDRVLRNNAKIKANAEQKTGVDLDIRDQGFTRPKVLLLLPTRNAAYDYVQRIFNISGLAQSENRKRFKDAFYQPSVDLSSKPADFQKAFAGNTNEVFCLGVKFTRQALKLYTSFYVSDLIIASPLGLRLIVDKKDFDFLSSVELVVGDQLDAAAQQSWANVKQVFEKLNAIPKNPHDCDFSRVREWYLNDQARFLRQTVLLSSFPTPEMVALFNKQCRNVAGKLRARQAVAGTLSNLPIHIRQVFTRVSVSSFSQDATQRFAHFANSLLPSIMRGAQTNGVLIVAPSYTDFVVLRNHLEKNDYSYVALSEYTSPSQLGRGRTFFANGKAKIMLYSARLHHYRRYSIKGVHTIVFFGLPDNPVFYAEFLKGLARTVLEQHVDPDLLKVHVLFTKWDALKLERVVGTKRMGAFIEGASDTHEFY